ncbi:MAG: hypothetical protein HN982_02990 [Candidatus Marinimicrobia bacterium]|jgi:hypothetical protein|nr:hypothetical protein [Candidatus Neomarinimicrobiota bacterium]MBT7901889.1 hypothetical protein [Candidatus Neomarinimicrobiota bacterium]
MFVRKNKLCNQIVFVDGMWGAGKSILAPVLGSFKRVEKQIINHNFEYVCTLENYDKISNTDAKSLIQVMADVSIFNSMISREVNLRPSDDSGFLNNPNGWRYLKRLFKVGDATILEKIKNDKPILQIMSHNIFQVSNLLFDSFDSSIKMIVMVRHPVYMTEHWFNYIDRVGIDLREFTLAKGEKGDIPWFASEDNYLSLNTMDRVIYGMKVLTSMQNKIFTAMTGNRKKQVLFIPFESFVLDPKEWIEKTTKLLKTEETHVTNKVLKKQRCPRDNIHAGKGHLNYGFDKNLAQLSEDEDYMRRLEFINEKATPEAIKVLKNLSAKYNSGYSFPRKMPWETIPCV